MSFGKMVKTARLAKDLTLRKLGNLIHYPFSLISEIENGTRTMPDNPQLLESLVNTLGLDMNTAKQQIRQDYVQHKPAKLVMNLMQRDQFAATFCRASEEMTEDEICEAIINALNNRKEG